MYFGVHDSENGSDSDQVDEEIEHQLYSSVFFEHSTQIDDCTLDTVDSVSEEFVLNFQRPNSNSAPLEAIVTQFQDEPSSEAEEFVMESTPMVITSGSASGSIVDDWRTDSGSLTPSELPLLNVTSQWTPEQVVLGNKLLSTPTQHTLKERLAIGDLLESKSNDPKLWTIDPADYAKPRANTRDTRYFKDDLDGVCSKCNNHGHTSFQCRLNGPVCIFCGEQGHLKDKCPEVYCFACLSPGHMKNQCDLLSHLKRCVCTRCGLKGHESHLCSELWRQYKSTTHAGKPIPIPRRMFVHPRGCCNCGRRGHTVDECKCQPFRSNFIGPPPRRRVFVYDKKDIYKKKALKSLFVSERKRFRRLSKQFSLDEERSLQGAILETADSPFVDVNKTVNRRLLQQIVAQECNESFVPEESVEGDTSLAVPGMSPLDRIKFRRNSSVSEDAFLPLNAQKHTRRLQKKEKRRQRRFNQPSEGHANSFFSLYWKHKHAKRKENSENEDCLLSVSPSVSARSESMCDISPLTPLTRKPVKRKLQPVPSEHLSLEQPSVKQVSAGNSMSGPEKLRKRKKKVKRVNPETGLATDEGRKQKVALKRKKSAEPILTTKSRVYPSHTSSDDLLHFCRAPIDIEPWGSTPQKCKIGRKKRKFKKSHSTSELLDCLSQ